MPSVADPTQNPATGFFQNQQPTNSGPDTGASQQIASQGAPAASSAPSAPDDISGFSFDPASGPPKLGPNDRDSSAPDPNIPMPQQSQQPQYQPPTPYQQQPAAAPTWAKQLQQAGIDPSGFRSPDDLANAYLQSQRQMRELETFAQYGQQFLPYASQFSEFMRSRQAPEAQPQAQPQPQKSIDDTLREHWQQLWKAPEYDPSWENMVKMNPETGFYEGINPFVPAQVVQGMNARRDWMRTSLNKMLEDPFGMQWKAMQPGIEAVVRQQVERELSAYNVNREFDSLEQQYATVLYQHDAQGNRLTDPFTGQPKWTPFGAHVAEEMRRLNAAGLTDPFVNFEYAVNSAKAMLFDQSRQQPQQPQQFAQAPPIPQQPQLQQPYQGQPNLGNPYQIQPQPYQQPQYPSAAQHYGLQPAPSAPSYAPAGAGSPYNAPPVPVPSMYQPAVSAGHPVYGGLNTGMNGQLPVGGGFMPQPPQSFLDNARMAGQQGHADGAVPPSGYASDEDYFSREASRLGYLSAA